MTTRPAISHTVLSLLCVGLNLGVASLSQNAIAVSARITAKAVDDTASLQAQVRKLRKQIKKAKKISSAARRRSILKRLKKKLRRSKASLAMAQLTIVQPPVSTPPPFNDSVLVANIGNPSDDCFLPNFPTVGSNLGTVNYLFWIGRFEATNSQYVEFLNAVSKADPNELFNQDMEDDPRGGIVQSSTSPNFSYAVKPNMENKPVNFVSFWDACRFCNWLHNGKPTGEQTDFTTEDGAYTLTTGTVSMNSVFRNQGAEYFIPAENEWHKAAYYDPSGINHCTYPGSFSGHSLYPNKSDVAPVSATADLSGNIITFPPVDPTSLTNYNSGADWNGQDGNVTTVGSGGIGSASFYGAFDMGGNVREWTEGKTDPTRVVRGGSWFHSSSDMISFNGSALAPETEDAYTGFRVASP